MTEFKPGDLIKTAGTETKSIVYDYPFCTHIIHIDKGLIGMIIGRLTNQDPNESLYWKQFWVILCDAKKYAISEHYMEKLIGETK